MADSAPSSRIDARLGEVTERIVRRSRDARVGRVGLRGRGGAATLSTISCSRCSASAWFISWLRCACALITTTPSAVMRWSLSASSRTFTSSGKEEARTSKRR